jgi:lantibiotic biosynthesis protein
LNAVSRQQALTTAERLLKADDVPAAIPAADAASLAHGLAGTALLHARLARADSTFEAAAVRHWTAAAAQASRHGGSAGIFHTPGGLAASLIIGQGYLPDPDPQRASTVRATQWLSARAIDLAHRHQEQVRRGYLGTPWAVYDVISGLAGIGRVLLAAVASGHDVAEPGLITALDTLTTMIRTCHGNRPGWWLSPSGHPPTAIINPSGAATTGSAHGIAGPISLLSIACASGWEVTGQRTAIGEAARWLLKWRDACASRWPSHVTSDELDSGIRWPVSGRQDAWCYGAPGIGRALSLAGHALGDPVLTHTGETAIASLAGRPAQHWDVTGPTLCHGHAGVLQCAAASQNVTADRAAAAVHAAFSADHPFGFQHLDKGAARDEPGLLTGAAGIALALADHGGLPGGDAPVRWDAILLLS